MSPKEFKEVREKFGLTQIEFASSLGLTQKTVSQYEMGFRSPGPTVKVIVSAIDTLPMNQARKLLELMKDVSDALRDKKTRRST